MNLPNQKGFTALLQDLNLTKKESARLIFCFTLINIYITIFWVNFYEQDKKRVERILNLTLDAFNKAFEEMDEEILLGDYVLDNEEINFINIFYNQMDITEETHVNIRMLFDCLYECRMEKYRHAIDKQMDRVIKEEKPLMIDPIARSFMKDFTGEDWKNNDATFFKLSFFLLPHYFVLGKFVSGIL